MFGLRRNNEDASFDRAMDALVRAVDSDGVIWEREGGPFTRVFVGTFGYRNDHRVRIDMAAHRDAPTISFVNCGKRYVSLTPLGRVVAEIAEGHVKAAEEKAAAEQRARIARQPKPIETIFVGDERTSLDTLTIEQLQEIIVQATSRLDPEAKYGEYATGQVWNHRKIEAAEKCIAEIRRRTPTAHSGSRYGTDGNYSHRVSEGSAFEAAAVAG
jgi:hypothetical protein